MSPAADGGVGAKLAAGLGQQLERRGAIAAEETVGMGGEAVARQAGIENHHLAAGAAELGGGGETGEAAAMTMTSCMLVLAVGCVEW
jgi:hypothetical protein